MGEFNQQKPAKDRENLTGIKRDEKSGGNPITPSASSGGKQNGGSERGSESSGNRTETKKETQSSGLAIVKQGTPNKIPIPLEVKKAKKPRKSHKKKDAELLANYSQLSALLMAGTGIVATRPGLQMWEITKEEADSIAKPAYSLLEKSAAFSKIAEHSDAVSLAMACGMVFIPRLIATASAMKEKKKKENPMEVKPNAGKIKTADGKHDEKNAAPSESARFNLETSAIPFV